MSQPCADPHQNPSSRGITTWRCSRLLWNVRKQLCPSVVALGRGPSPAGAVHPWVPLAYSLFLLPSFVSSAQSPTVADPLQQAYAGMQHYAGLRLCLALLPSLPSLLLILIFPGGQHHLGDEPRDWGSVLGHGLMRQAWGDVPWQELQGSDGGDADAECPSLIPGNTDELPAWRPMQILDGESEF